MIRVPNNRAKSDTNQEQIQHKERSEQGTGKVRVKTVQDQCKNSIRLALNRVRF